MSNYEMSETIPSPTNNTTSVASRSKPRVSFPPTGRKKTKPPTEFGHFVEVNSNTREPEEDSDDTPSSTGISRLAESQRRALLKRTFSLVPERFEGVHLPQPGASRVASRLFLLFCEYLLLTLSFSMVALFFPLSLCFCVKVIVQYERAVIFRLGKLMSQEASGPGLVFHLPCVDTIKRVDLRTFTFDVPTQEVLTRDSVTVAVDAVVYYRIFDPVMSVVNVEEANRSTRLLSQTTLRNVLGTVDLSTLLADRENIAAMMQETLDVATDTWGVKVERVEVKDVRLPVQLQRAMAAEAEATRESKARVIAAKGERLASRALRLAAEEISECPVALQLRYLQTLNTISAEKNSTIIFPLPTDLLSYCAGESSSRSMRGRAKKSASHHKSIKGCDKGMQAMDDTDTLQDSIII